MNKPVVITSIISGLLVLYYYLKPVMPRRLRYWLRRILARRTLAGTTDWPIKAGTEVPPSNWPGWPQGRRFAVVLTHDVEGRVGVNRCRQLMELESRLGFKSSFNFVPEGEYRVSDDLREELVQRGCEVGVHDLYHDGTLFRSQQDFVDQSEGINRYLAEWDAVGFRAGFMFHNLNWLRLLNAKYDASTFDVDPFEPQPEGIHTIFPFWVESSDGLDGYVELPYTLVQDSTLFLLLREKSIRIWKRKLDWVAANGGMVLLNVHPDYMNFEGSALKWNQYPSALYAELLEYIRTKYQGEYWQALPREVAEYCTEFKPKPSRQVANSPSGRVLLNPQVLVGQTAAADCLRDKRAVVVVFSHYPSDPRPRRAAEALVQHGMKVDVICIKSADDEASRESFNGVNILRLPLRHRRGSKFNYVFQYAAFILASFGLLTLRTLTRRYQFVHVHNMPDVLVFSALVPKLCGARVILDLHDPMPELMTTIFGFNADSRTVRLLKRLEKWSTGFADAVITVNLACKKIFTSRSCPAEKLLVVMNSPDEGIFKYREAPSPTSWARDPAKPFVMMYHGSLVERHGLDIAVQALELARAAIPNLELRVYGRPTPYVHEVMESVKQRRLEKFVHYLGENSLEKIAAAIDECDLGLIPNRRSVFTEINTPTRIFEYLARAKPVIAPLAGGITDYFSPEDLIYFNLGDAEDLARKMEYVYAHPREVGEIVRRGQDIYRAHRWGEERMRFLDLTCELLGGYRRRKNRRLASAVKPDIA
jgi:glycosyltransferase involved in cell wall biosynthesis